MWGIPHGVKDVTFGLRITPTHVGNTSRQITSANGQQGSPPHMWGVRYINGIIDPRVGNTATRRSQAVR